MSELIETDICVIGAGSGGLSVAAGAVQMGARVVLIEAGEMGGDCLNAGCVPSKALIEAGARAQLMRQGFAGVQGVEPAIDYAAAMEHVQNAIKTIAPHDSQERFERLGCIVIRDWARFVGPDLVQAGARQVRARRFVIATGARPAIPPVEGLADVPYLTNETLWDLRERPDHLLIMGGGPIGLEMAQAHRRLGARVTVFERGAALAGNDPELAALALEALRAEGVDILEGATVAQAAGTKGAITLTLEDGRQFTGSHLLVATGRRAQVDDMGLEAAGVEYSARGITVGADLRSSNRRVYALGDVAGGLQFTHLAGYQAGVLVRALCLGLPAKSGTSHIPKVTYTDPALAQIGLTEREAREQYGDLLTVARADFASNDRAIAAAQTKGALKVMVARGRAVGVTMVAHDAGELIGPWALAMAKGLKLSAISAMVAAYPSRIEINKAAASAYFSPKLFENAMLQRIVQFVQRWVR